MNSLHSTLESRISHLSLCCCFAFSLLAQSGCARVLGFGHAGGQPPREQPVDGGPPVADAEAGVLSTDAANEIDASPAPEKPDADEADASSERLRALGLSVGELAPSFSADVHRYRVRLGLSSAELTLTPVAAGSRITVQGEAVSSGTASQPIPLNLGETEILVSVTQPNKKPDTYELIVDRASGLLNEAYLKASDPQPDDRFGSSIALSQGTLAIGAPLDDTPPDPPLYLKLQNSGSVYVFVQEGADWVQQAFIQAGNRGNDDRFGSSIALFHDTLAVGAPTEASSAHRVNGEMNNEDAAGSGAVYVFERSAGEWSQRTYLKASSSEPFAAFGSALALSASTLAVGSPNARCTPDGATSMACGAVFIFERDERGDWFEKNALYASTPDDGDAFGSSLSLSGRRLLVGAPGEDSDDTVVNGDEHKNVSLDSGAAYVFERVDQDWTQTTYLKPVNTRPGIQFGHAVALAGATLAVGAPQENNSARGVNASGLGSGAVQSGAVYLFAHGGETWEQTAYIKASNTGAGDRFGYALALWDGVLAVGAADPALGTLGEDSSAQGVNGNQEDESASASGAVYLFTGQGTNWVQQVYLKGSNAAEGDVFGSALALADGQLAVGAPLEDSNASGVGGDSANDSAGASGAVYVRRVLPKPPATGSGAPGLQDLQISEQLGPALDLAFDPATRDYSVLLGTTVESIEVQATLADPDAELTIAGNAAASDTWKVIASPFGDTEVEVGVLSTMGEYSNYWLYLARPLPIATAQRLGVADAEAVTAEMYATHVVALSGDTLAIGVPYDDDDDRGVFGTPDSTAVGTDSGAVFIYTRTAEGWQRQAYLKASNADPGDLFGIAIALDGDTLLVGATNESSASQGVEGEQDNNDAAASGAVYVFVRQGTHWQQQAYLKASNAAAGDAFGTSLALEGDTAVVGAPRESNTASGEGGYAYGSGAVYVFQRSGELWQETDYLKASNTRDSAEFGTQVSLSGKTLAVSAPYEGGNSSTLNGDQWLIDGFPGGAVYVFSYTQAQGLWQQEAYLKPPNYMVDVGFGRSLDLDGTTLAVGAPYDLSRSRQTDGDPFNVQGNSNGSVFIFEAEGDPNFSRSWRQHAYLKSKNSEELDQFGGSVALSGDTLAVGAPAKRGTPPVHRRGAAYLFTNSEAGWSQAAYLEPPKAAPDGAYGANLALSGQDLVIGNSSYVDAEFWDPESHGSVQVMSPP